jgi:hypothetical protein
VEEKFMPNWHLALFYQALEAMNLIAANLSLGSWGLPFGPSMSKLGAVLRQAQRERFGLV